MSWELGATAQAVLLRDVAWSREGKWIELGKAHTALAAWLARPKAPCGAGDPDAGTVPQLHPDVSSRAIHDGLSSHSARCSAKKVYVCTASPIPLPLAQRSVQFCSASCLCSLLSFIALRNLIKSSFPLNSSSKVSQAAFLPCNFLLECILS